jgi:hypothetical protein
LALVRVCILSVLLFLVDQLPSVARIARAVELTLSPDGGFYV